jgi:dTDP-4-amino-4,6-dideoxygalactose transaminase
LREKGVAAVFHYLPLNRSEFARAQALQEIKDRRWQLGNCPVTEVVSDRIVRLPFYTSMTAEEQGRVIQAVLEFRG